MSNEWINPFLTALKRTGIIARACEASGASYGAVLRLRKADADFAAAFDEAMEQAVDRAEAEAWRRAIEGVEEPVVYQGQLTPLWERDETGQIIHDVVIRREYDAEAGEYVDRQHNVPRQQLDEQGNPRWLTIRKHSDALLQFILKGRRKAFSTERTELTGADGAPLQMSDAEREARLAQILAAAKQRKQQADDLGEFA